jgi:FkbM family methyltransferase
MQKRRPVTLPTDGVRSFEMLPDKFRALQTRFAGDPANTVIHAAVWDADGVELPLFRASNGESSSLMKPKEHLESHPRITFAEQTGIATSRLDSILPATANFDYLSLDIQGAELRALKGLGAWLPRVKWACVEVNTRRLYADCALITELDAFLDAAGFARLLTKMAVGKGWGDALYVNSRLLPAGDVSKLRHKAMIWQAKNFMGNIPKYLRGKTLSRMLRSS